MTVPSLYPCETVNPVLWRLFVTITKRENDSAPHLTERDVYNWARDWIVRGRISEMSLRTDAMRADFGLPKLEETK